MAASASFLLGGKMDNLQSFKELYDVKLKATYNMEINGRTYEPGEILTTFDKIQMSMINEIKPKYASTGGFDNRKYIIWDETTEIDFSFSQGVFSRLQLAMLDNARLLEYAAGESLVLTQREHKEIDENGQVQLKYEPVAPIFVYELETGERIKDFRVEGTNLVFTDKKYVDVVVDYSFNYLSGYTNMIVGRYLLSGFLELEGRTRFKEDQTGIDKTGIIRIPRLKLMSDLSIRLGENANPVIANFRAVGLPIGDRGSKKVMELFFLDDDIDSDI